MKMTRWRGAGHLCPLGWLGGGLMIWISCTQTRRSGKESLIRVQSHVATIFPPRHVPKSSARIKERRPSPSRELELRRTSHCYSVHLFSSERRFPSLVSHSVGTLACITIADAVLALL